MDELRGVVTYAATDPTAGGIATISSGSGQYPRDGRHGRQRHHRRRGRRRAARRQRHGHVRERPDRLGDEHDPTEGGNDTITAGTGYNLIIGGPGNNILAGSTGPDVILGANGSIVATSGSASIFQGSTVKSTSPGVGGSDTITGGSGHQILIGGPGSDAITGGSGTGLIFGGDAQVTLSGTTVASYASIDIGPSGGGTDTIHAGNGSATIYGGPGNDTITGGPGTDVINGGDTVANGASGFDQIQGATSTDTLTFDFTPGIPAGSHPAFAFQDTIDFTTGIPSPFGPTSGSWSLASGSYQGTPSSGTAVSLFSIKSQQSTYEQLQATVNTQSEAGLVYDYVSSTNFKFAAVLAQTGQVVLGHMTSQGLVNDVVASKGVRLGQNAILAVTLGGSSVTLYLNGVSAITESYSGSSLAAGQLGLFASGGAGKFNDFMVRGTALSSTGGTMDAMAEAFALSAGSTSSDAATTGQEALPSAAAASVPAAATAASTIGQDAMTSPTTPTAFVVATAASAIGQSTGLPGAEKVRVKPRHHRAQPVGQPRRNVPAPASGRTRPPRVRSPSPSCIRTWPGMGTRCRRPDYAAGPDHSGRSCEPRAPAPHAVFYGGGGRPLTCPPPRGLPCVCAK